jgi:hypothetical protein
MENAMPVSNKDKTVVRELATQVAAVAALPIQQERIDLWKASNDLHPKRPMVNIDQVCWNEMNVDDELTLQSEDGLCQFIEFNLRERLYRHKHLPVDFVVEPFVDVPKVYHSTGLGITIHEEIAVTDPQNSVVGHRFIDQLETEADLAKIHNPEITLDEKATDELEAKANEILDGAMPVHMQGNVLPFSPWDTLATWRSAEKILWDLIDRPEFMHAIMRKLTEANLCLLDQMEEQGLLSSSYQWIHCTGAYTDQLPAPGYDPKRVRAKDTWCYGQAQVFSTVSPAMHKAFDLDYAVQWYERFGLGYYGCCEPLDAKVHLIKSLPHVRKISMSPWTNQERGAEQLGKDFVFSRKPNPAFLAVDDWNAARVAEDLRTTVKICKAHGCPVELILKDISTVRYQPQRLWEWAEIAMQVVQGN